MTPVKKLNKYTMLYFFTERKEDKFERAVTPMLEATWWGLTKSGTTES